MVPRTTCSFVHVWDVLAHIGYSQDEQTEILDIGFSNVSWGDAPYTLIGNNFCLDCIIIANMGLDEPLDPEVILTRFWEVVQPDDYVNMEGNG